MVKPTFSFKSKVAALAHVGSHIRVRSYVFLEHAWLLTTNATLFTYILSPTTAPHIHIFLIGLVPDKDKTQQKTKRKKKKERTLSLGGISTVTYQH